jgi:hypothetical protein
VVQDVEQDRLHTADSTTMILPVEPGDEIRVPAAAVRLEQASQGCTARVLCPIAACHMAEAKPGDLVVAAGDDVTVRRVTFKKTGTKV